MSRPGDWRCPSCNNHNFKFRVVCNRCQLPKPEGTACDISRESKGRTRPGDWECCECGNRNFAFRDECNRCELPRFVTQTFVSASLLETAPGSDAIKVPSISLFVDDGDAASGGAPGTPPAASSDCSSDGGSDGWGRHLWMAPGVGLGRAPGSPSSPTLGGRLPAAVTPHSPLVGHHRMAFAPSPKIGAPYPWSPGS
mmetsp:Transcript_23376/g.61169  ORF Transcript_23376/g.61169 Transcript_23376/m.61169 type:complete len:197 (+) Transcript_23376:181-771(+)